MNPQIGTDEHLLLIRGTHWNRGVSPAELQRVMTDFYAWVDGLMQRGVHRGAQPLLEEGKLVTGAKGARVTDGVFAESKEAIRLALLLAAHPVTRQPRTHALVALMLFNAARLGARTDDAGQPLRLHEQDRSSWNQAMIARGAHHLALAASGDAVSEYHLQAGIAACHSMAANECSTDWPRILKLYDQLVRLNPSLIVALNRSVALARVHCPAAGLAALDDIPSRRTLNSYFLYHAVRGTFHAELGHRHEAVQHFHQAEHLASLPSERDFLARKSANAERRANRRGSAVNA